MVVKFYLIQLLFYACCSGGSEFVSNSVNLDYCEIQKLFCKEFEHVACFSEANLRNILASNTVSTCAYDFMKAVKNVRLRNGVKHLQWNRELESFAMLTPNNDTEHCAVSVQFLDTRFFIAKQNQNYKYTTFQFLGDNRTLYDPLVTDIGCSCKQFHSENFVYCWYNYSKRETAAKYENLVNSAQLLDTSAIYLIIIVSVFNTRK